MVLLKVMHDDLLNSILQLIIAMFLRKVAYNSCADHILTNWELIDFPN
jgi:hypothetical protein